MRNVPPLVLTLFWLTLFMLLRSRLFCFLGLALVTLEATNVRVFVVLTDLLPSGFTTK